MTRNLVTGGVLGAVILSLTACGGSDAPVDHRVLGPTAESLRAAFDADSGKVRAIFLASPTCGMCLRGVRDLNSTWLQKTASDQVAVYVVWSSQLGAEERHLADAARLIPDERVRHFWDGDQVVGRRFAPHLGLGSPAWDVWMLFGRGASWTDPEGAPEPGWWEHQLGALPDSLHLDPERFARKAAELLASG